MKAIKFTKRLADRAVATARLFFWTVVAWWVAPAIAYASATTTTTTTGSYTAPLDNLKNVLLTIAKAAGAIMVVYGGIRFALAFQKMDQNGEHSAVFTIVAGGILIGLGLVIDALLA